MDANGDYSLAITPLTSGATTTTLTGQIADPRGDVLVLAPEDRPAVVVTELDLGLILDQRIQEPIQRGYRPELYRFHNK